MVLTTDRGTRFQVNWAWAPVGYEEDLMFELTKDSRPISQIASDFEGLTRIHRSDTPEGEMDYDGYSDIRSIVRQANGAVEIRLFKTPKE